MLVLAATVIQPAWVNMPTPATARSPALISTPTQLTMSEASDRVNDLMASTQNALNAAQYALDSTQPTLNSGGRMAPPGPNQNGPNANNMRVGISPDGRPMPPGGPAGNRMGMPPGPGGNMGMLPTAGNMGMLPAGSMWGNMVEKGRDNENAQREWVSERNRQGLAAPSGRTDLTQRARSSLPGASDLARAQAGLQRLKKGGVPRPGTVNLGSTGFVDPTSPWGNMVAKGRADEQQKNWMQSERSKRNAKLWTPKRTR